MKPGILNLSAVDKDYVAIIQLRHQTPGVIQQVAIRPDKIHEGFIRFGETPQVDEAHGWQDPKNVLVLSVLGTLEPKHDPDGLLVGWATKPIEKPVLYEVKSAEEAYAMACP